MDFDGARARLVADLRQSRFIKDDMVADAMLKVPREQFVPRSMREEAYTDSPLSIGSGQTISAPHMVAIMVEASQLKSGHKVLEIGAGSGYHAAVVAELVRPGGRVFTVERVASLAKFAGDNINRTGYGNTVQIICGDGSNGLPEEAPFDRIFVACAAPDVPMPLKAQLADGGRLLVPVGGRYFQKLMLVERKGSKFNQEDLGGCVFVPLIGEHGYRTSSM
ncbi:MAG: protein-L-isoaspartate(D-aspartate) O-methyltransferase [Candidatus Thermoplasmatota archaeon]|nr:protein-L-isoaspartate(D-aspartate) O-methyltransferase [Candidatus Thermoplasmatota archaeon]